MATFSGIDYIWRINLIHGFTLIYRVTCPSIGYGLTLKYGVAYSNIVHRFSLDYKGFSSTIYTLVYGALPRDLVRVPPLGYTIWSSYPPTLKLPLLVYIYSHLVEYLYSSLVDLVLSYFAAPKLLLLYLALDHAYMPMLLTEDPILSYIHLSKPCIDYDVPY